MSMPAGTKNLRLGFVPGTGNMGLKLARNHARAGNPVIVGSREKKKGEAAAAEILKELKDARITGGTNLDAAAGADVVFFGPQGSLDERNALLKSLAPHIKGKIVVDLTNIAYLPFFTADKWGQLSSTDICASIVPDARWVCGYKNTFSRSLDSLKDKDGIPLDVLIASNDKEAKATVVELVTNTGFRGLDAGNLQHIRIIELMGPPWIVHMNQHSISGSCLGAWRFR